ncbi:hypothetical protein A33Q_1653 [Indibacter alkaliphilus LW1]|uniref:Uncharacterized protein n=1 Tax=Indibacter alkaliphilus (strain CCUG 57479 / KCTC 22604 / LW1) TaxID=1189612 RepID=S2DFX8_INDAL|nr:hypothetical protein A33Q_1653 [Indibacter alkaliphilus LW1]
MVLNRGGDLSNPKKVNALNDPGNPKPDLVSSGSKKNQPYSR